MYPMIFVKKEERHHISQQHCSCFYLGITRTEAFLMASNASYLDVRSMAFSRSVALCCLSSTNIMLSLRDHIIILY